MDLMDEIEKELKTVHKLTQYNSTDPEADIRLKNIGEKIEQALTLINKLKNP